MEEDLESGEGFYGEKRDFGMFIGRWQRATNEQVVEDVARKVAVVETKS